MVKSRIITEHPFPPVIDARSRILILGSIPSVVSVKKGYYYAHPTNRFYPVLSAILGKDLTTPPWEEKRHLLLEHQIALYDAIVAGKIEGSSDLSIEGAQPVSLEALLQGYGITHIYCNGLAAYRTIIKAYPSFSLPITLLPSTSAANAIWSLDRLIQAWRILFEP